MKHKKHLSLELKSNKYMGQAGFEPATMGLAVGLTKNPSPKPGTLSRLDYRPNKKLLH